MSLGLRIRKRMMKKGSEGKIEVRHSGGKFYSRVGGWCFGRLGSNVCVWNKKGQKVKEIIWKRVN